LRVGRVGPCDAAALAAGYIIAGRNPEWSQFFWYPIIDPRDPTTVDAPIWSLVLEAWAMPFMPLIVWVGTASFSRAALAMFVTICAGCFYAPILVLGFFIAGAFLSRKMVRNAWLESAIPQWLGKISYSLYLTHFLVVTVFVTLFGPLGAILCLPVVFGIA